MSDTKEFDVIRVARSDGADTGPGYWPTTSTAAKKTAGKEMALSEKTPRVKPQMTRLSEDDPRFVEWRIKLGILLKQELSPNPEGKATTQLQLINQPASSLFLHNIKRTFDAENLRV